MAIQTKSLSSSVLASASYDPETREMELTFTSGRSYTYNEVPQETFDALASAPSAGRYFNNFIKDIYF